MPLQQNNTRTFHRTLYGAILESVTVLKRNDDQQEGTVRAIKLYQCRRSSIFKTGEPIQGDMSSNHRVTWHIPKVEMERTGINNFNALDRIVDKQGRYWQPESFSQITEKLFSNHWCLDCLRVDPPKR